VGEKARYFAVESQSAIIIFWISLEMQNVCVHEFPSEGEYPQGNQTVRGPSADISGDKFQTIRGQSANHL